MTCPKCQEGTLGTIQFKNTKVKGLLCDFCEALWLENEDVNEASAHTLRSYSQGGDFDYTFDELDDGDEEDKPAHYVRYR